MGKGKEMITLRELKEKAVSKQQQKLMGLALAYKRGDVPDSEVSDTVKDLAKSMSTKELEDFASTKHKGLPQKKEDNNISNRSAALKPQTYNDPNTGQKKVRMVPSKSNIVKTNDRVDEAFKKGDVVKVNLGPHKHLKHEVIHAFDDGTYNIKPYDLAPSKNRYRGGAIQVKSNQIKKLDEAKSSTGYELYHRDFSSAMQHAYKHAKAKLGVDVDPEEIDKKVAMGPSKPSKGKTNSYRLLDKGGKKAIQVQVYGMDNGKYELNMYKESVDINEAHDPKHVKMAIGVSSDKRYKQGNYSGAVRAIEKIKKGLSKHPQVAAVLKRQNEAKDPGEYDNEGEMAKNQLQSILRDAEHMIEMFDDEENLPEWVQNKITKAQDYLQSAHSYMMGQDEDDDEKEVKEYLEVGTDAIRKSYASMTPGQNEALAPIDRVAIAGTLALGAKGISKTKKTVGNLAKKVTKLGSKPKPIASKPKSDTSADTTAPNKRPMPAKSNFSNLRKRQQTRAKTKMGSKKSPIRRV